MAVCKLLYYKICICHNYTYLGWNYSVNTLPSYYENHLILLVYTAVIILASLEFTEEEQSVCSSQTIEPYCNHYRSTPYLFHFHGFLFSCTILYCIPTCPDMSPTCIWLDMPRHALTCVQFQPLAATALWHIVMKDITSFSFYDYMYMHDVMICDLTWPSILPQPSTHPWCILTRPAPLIWSLFLPQPYTHAWWCDDLPCPMPTLYSWMSSNQLVSAHSWHSIPSEVMLMNAIII